MIDKEKRSDALAAAVRASDANKPGGTNRSAFIEALHFHRDDMGSSADIVPGEPASFR